jgi:hypothetical protein
VPRPWNSAEQFWTHVERTATGCWLWQGFRMRNGYGTVKWHNRTKLVHRIAYQLVNGPIDADMQVCHTCDVRHCVNPAHLWLGSAQDNSTDMAEKGRARSGSKLHPERMPRGEQHWTVRRTHG